MSNLLYIDCQAGIAGDMMVAALIELGLPLDFLREQLALLALPLSAYTLVVERVQRQGIAATSFTVRAAEHQPHRHYTGIAAMIEGSSLSEGVKEKAQRIFFRLAEAEAKVHGVAIDRVHFHEVGGIDSIIDIVGTAIGLEYFGISAIYVSALPLGSGFVETAHGRLPVPAPATAELLRGLPVHGGIGPGERVTPTGAAIVAALGVSFGRAPAMQVAAIGYGAGSNDYPDLPNVVRLVLGEVVGSVATDQVYVLETQIDDMNPEIFGFLMERLLERGALDVTFSPVQMKKNRPGSKLTVLAPPERLDELARLVLRESTALGVRYYPVERLTLTRSVVERDTSLGKVRVKVAEDGAGMRRIAPEYEECRRIANEQGLALLEVYRIIEREVVA